MRGVDVDLRGRPFEQRVQVRLGTPQRRRLRARGRRQVTAEDLEQLADEAARGPVGHADAPAGAAHPRHLGGGARVVGGEHHAEGGEDGVEARVAEGQRLDVGRLELDFQALGARALGAALEQGLDVVGRDDLAAAARRGEGGVAVAGRHVEHALVPAQVAGFGELLADDLQGGADDGVVAARPGGLLAGLEGVEVGGCVHGRFLVSGYRVLRLGISMPTCSR